LHLNIRCWVGHRNHRLENGMKFGLSYGSPRFRRTSRLWCWMCEHRQHRRYLYSSSRFSTRPGSDNVAPGLVACNLSCVLLYWLVKEATMLSQLATSTKLLNCTGELKSSRK
jgi:hypothetical protein